MMKAVFLFTVLTMFVSGKQVDLNNSRREALKCYGYKPCSACTTCNYCQYCNSGGTCGVCAHVKKAKGASINPQSKPQAGQRDVSTQCRAITKKGTRCTRTARSNGYCWQHGG
jgi:hypothetical protein